MGQHRTDHEKPCIKLRDLIFKPAGYKEYLKGFFQTKIIMSFIKGM